MRVSFDTEYQESHVIKLRKDAVFNLKVAQPGLPFTNFFLLNANSIAVSSWSSAQTKSFLCTPALLGLCWSRAPETNKS
jgi:hypothetical protein